MIEHSTISEGERHGVANWEVLTAAARDALSVGITDVGKVCHVLGRGMFTLASVGPAVWEPIAREVMIGTTGARYCYVGGVLRQASAGAGWELIEDANHESSGVASVTVDGSGNIALTFDQTYDSKISFLAVPDETFSSWGMRVGASVGNDSATLELYAPLSGPLVASDSTPLTPITPLGQDITQTLDAANGTITITHATQSHTSGWGTAAVAMPTRNNGRWQIASDKSSVTLTYTRRLDGGINWSGGVFTMNTDAVYPAAVTVVGTSAGSGGKVRIQLASDPGFITGHRATVAGVLGTTEANVSDAVLTRVTATTYDIEGTVYVNPFVASSGTCTMTKAVWVTDHLEVFHPNAGSAVPCQLQKYKTANKYVLEVDPDTLTAYGFHVYFYDMAGTAVTTPDTSMRFCFDRNVWLPTAIPASDVGVFVRDNVKCNAANVYSANGNIWFGGWFKKTDT